MTEENNTNLQVVRILHLEDNPQDAELVGITVRRTFPGAQILIAQNEDEYKKAIDCNAFDLILSDYVLPYYDGDKALLHAQQKCPYLPFIMVTGELGEDFAIERLKNGAFDYVLKDNLKRLVPAIRHALVERDERRRRQDAEEALRESEERYRLLFEESPLTKWVVDRESLRFVAVNNTAVRLYGYTREEFLGKRLGDIRLPEEYAKLVDRRREEAEVPHGMTISKHRTKDGRYLDVEVHFNEIAFHGRKALLCVVNDLTEKERSKRIVRESQEQLANIISSAMDAVIAADEERRIILFNAAAETMFQVAASEAIGRPLDRFIPPFYRGHQQKHLDRFGGGPETMGRLGAIYGVRAAGEEFPIEASISQVTSGGKKVVTVILRDITDRVRQEREIRALNSDLEQRVRERTEELAAANKELEGFTYSVSHDLKAPLRAITGFSHALLEEALPHLEDDQKRYLQIINHNANHLGRLVEELLEFSRLSKKPLSKRPIDMREMAEEAVREARDSTQAANVTVTIGEMLPTEGDATLIRQVFHNLVGNAFKYTAKIARPEVEIGSTLSKEETIYYIRDNGAGFDMRFYDKLFGVFQRLHSPEEFEGTGIGLAFCQRIIQRHGGRIWAEGEVNRGATFYFSIPRMYN